MSEWHLLIKIYNFMGMHFSLKNPTIETKYEKSNFLAHFGCNRAGHIITNVGCQLKMAYRSFKYEYHDSSLVKFTIGPRREVELEIKLDPVWNKIDKTVNIRFGNIKNFEEVKQFFEKIPPTRTKDAFIAEIVGLEYEKMKPYPVIIDLSDFGDLLIETGNVTEI